MIPIRDANPSHRTPVVNITLIVINILVFFWELSLGAGLTDRLNDVAFIPARLWAGQSIGTDIFTIFFAMFLHGGWIHLGSNMLYLWIFGDNIEDRLGHGKYLFFYLACGVLATLAHAVMSPSSNIPSVGASGAIAGVLGAYLLLFPSARVMTFIPFGFFIAMRELPAMLVLGLWFVIQLFTGVASIGDVTRQDVGGVAWFAHIGGFVAGLLLIFLMGGRKQPTAYPRFQ
jgi:membrane associated rhomboid family serine protease